MTSHRATHDAGLPTASLLLFLLLASPGTLVAETSADLARAVIDEVEQLYRGNASRSSVTMIVHTPQYKRTLKMTAETLGREFALFRILSPKKDRGISTLKRGTQMWNFFPKIDRVIKVPPSMMMGSWMGSDFTNDDLVKETELIDAYDLSLKDKGAQYEITLTPRADTVTVWGKIDYIVDKDRMHPVTQTFYDDRGRKVRRMEFSQPREFEGHLLPSMLEMIPLNKEGHSTVVVYDDMAFDPDDIDEGLFSLRTLKSRF